MEATWPSVYHVINTCAVSKVCEGAGHKTRLGSLQCTHIQREKLFSLWKQYILWRRPANSSVSIVTVSLYTKNILYAYVAFHSFDTPLTWNPPTGPVILLLQQLSRLPCFALIIHQGGTSYLLTLGSRRDSVVPHHFPHDSAVTISQMTFTF